MRTRSGNASARTAVGDNRVEKIPRIRAIKRLDLIEIILEHFGQYIKGLRIVNIKV
jgi:hypothetical protein